MVSIYYGRAGTGKTYLLENEARRLSENGTRVFFVVPEQLSMSREYTFNGAGLKSIEVLSFTRLTNTVFRTLGGTAKKLPDNAMSAAAVYLAVMNVYSRLEYYKSVALSSGFIAKLMTVFAEFDTCCMSLKSIEAIPHDDLPQSVLRKYRDLFLIYDEYKRLWNGEYKAPGDDITLAAAMLETNDIFSDAVFMFDGFYGYTEQQLNLIRQIILQAAGCSFAFTTDLESPLFTTVTGEAHRIAALCKKCGVKCAFIPTDGVSHRIKNETLRFIEKYAFEDSAPAFSGDVKPLTVYAAKNLNEELNYIVCRIKNDVLDGKYRLRDIAVLAPDSDGISAVAAAVFAKHGVPAFVDIKKSLLSKPLTAMVLSAVEIARDGFTYESVFSFLKTGLAGISFDDISLLENYVRMWKIKGKGWLKERWTQSPSGLSKNEGDGERLEHINMLKAKVIPPLSEFVSDIKSAASCRQMLAAVCALFDRLNISGELLQRAQYFESAGDMHISDEYTRIYEIFIGMLDSIDEVFGQTRIDAQRFYDILSVCAQSITVSSRPACADEVIFSGIGRVRAENVKCVYICRLNDGFLPKAPVSGDLITDADKRLFAKYGITTSMDFVRSAARERFDLYSALTAASHELVLSCSMFEITGESLEKSEYLKNIERLTNAETVTASDLEPEFYLVSPDAACALMSGGEHRAFAEAIYGAAGITPVKERQNDRLSDDIVRGLYSKNLRLSFSGIEEYIGCPFKFFIHRGLRAQKSEPVEMNPANIGTFIHWGLERLLSGEYELNQADERKISEYISKISDEYYNVQLSDCKGSSKRFDRLFSRAKSALDSAALNVMREIRSSDFVPYDFEIDISKYVKPASLPDGRTLTLTGSIDRVDVMECEDGRYAKIIDYKSGSQEFSIKKIYNGLSMQLPIYAGAVRSKFPDIKVAAMYYLKVGVPSPKLTDKGGIDDAEFQAKNDEYYKRDGIFTCGISDSSRLGNDIKSLTNIKKDRLVSQSDMDGLIDFTKAKIRDTGCAIVSGNADISPVKEGNECACNFCDYLGICKISQSPERVRSLVTPPDDFLRKEKA